jgi:hypothetical protein
VDRLPKTKNSAYLAVPFSLRIFKRCTEYGVSSELIRHLHLYDLQCLLIQFDIQKVERYLQEEEKRKMREKGIKEIKDIDGSAAVRFLGR